jgi:protein-tyrosine phosphatase
MTARPLRVCFVCTGNICRSPTAEMVLRAMLSRAGLGDRVLADSAGTGPWHAGKEMDPRARETLLRHGYQPAPHVARQFQPADFGDRDLVLALDAGHLSRLGQLALAAEDPTEAVASISLLRRYDRVAAAAGDLDVPDPYYDDEQVFEDVLTLIEQACAGLLAALQPELAEREPELAALQPELAPPEPKLEVASQLAAPLADHQRTDSLSVER